MFSSERQRANLLLLISLLVPEISTFVGQQELKIATSDNVCALQSTSDANPTRAFKAFSQAKLTSKSTFRLGFLRHTSPACASRTLACADGGHARRPTKRSSARLVGYQTNVRLACKAYTNKAQLVRNNRQQRETSKLFTSNSWL